MSFLKKQHREVRTFVVGVKEITFTRVNWDNTEFWK